MSERQENFEDEKEYSLLGHIKNPSFADYLNDLTEEELTIFKLHTQEEMDEIEIAESLGISDDSEVLDIIESIYEQLTPAIDEQALGMEATAKQKQEIRSEFIQEMESREKYVNQELKKRNNRRGTL